MKKTISNYALENYVNTISNPDSFRNNVSIKLPAALLWNVRINMKMLMDRYSVLLEMKSELGKEFIDAGKVQDDSVKPEFLSEWSSRMNEIMSQSSEFDLVPINREDFIDRNDLSWPELDLLLLMTDSKGV